VTARAPLAPFDASLRSVSLTLGQCRGSVSPGATGALLMRLRLPLRVSGPGRHWRPADSGVPGWLP